MKLNKTMNLRSDGEILSHELLDDNFKNSHNRLIDLEGDFYRIKKVSSSRYIKLLDVKNLDLSSYNTQYAPVLFFYITGTVVKLRSNAYLTPLYDTYGNPQFFEDQLSEMIGVAVTHSGTKLALTQHGSNISPRVFQFRETNGEIYLDFIEENLYGDNIYKYIYNLEIAAVVGAPDLDALGIKFKVQLGLDEDND